MSTYKQQIRELKLVPGGGGCFELSANGLLPRIFSRLHPRHGSPYVAATFVAAASVPAVALSKAALEPLMLAASLCGIFALFVTCAAVRARRRKPGVAKPEFVAPGGKIGEGMLIATGAALFAVSLFEPFVSRPQLHLPVHWIFVAAWGMLGWALWSRQRGFNRVLALRQE